MNTTTCDNCNRRCERNHNFDLDGVFCDKCAADLADSAHDVTPEPAAPSQSTGRSNRSHRNCDHAATKTARAACRKAAGSAPAVSTTNLDAWIEQAARTLTLDADNANDVAADLNSVYNATMYFPGLHVELAGGYVPTTLGLKVKLSGGHFPTNDGPARVAKTGSVGVTVKAKIPGRINTIWFKPGQSIIVTAVRD